MEESIRPKVLQLVQNALLFGDSAVLPTAVDRHLMSFADQEFGENWVESDETVGLLDEGLKSLQKAQRSLDSPVYDRPMTLAYLFGHGPLSFHKVPFLMRNVLRKSVLPTELKVLDLGSGAGISSVSMIYFLELLANGIRIVTGQPEAYKLSLTPLDSSDAALGLYQRFIENYVPGFPELEVSVPGPIQTLLGSEGEGLSNTLGADKFHIIIASHILGENKSSSLSARARLLAELRNFLEPGGSILFAESAATAIPSEMNQLKSRAVAEGATLFSPCANAWEKPTGRQCYTCGNVAHEHVRKPMIADILETVCESYDYAKLEKRNSWSFGIFRADDSVHHPQLEGIGSGLFKKLSELEPSETERFSVYGSVAKVEMDRVTERPFFKICDQTCGSDSAYLSFDPTVGIPPLENGDVLEIEDARVLPPAAGRNKVIVLVDAGTTVTNLSRDFNYLSSKHVLTPEVLG